MVLEKAVVIISPKKEGLVTDRPIPTLRDDYIRVKTIAVALNPTDWKHVEFVSPPGVLIGCDYAGIVKDVGKDVKKNFKKGDRVCGCVHGANAVQPEDGAFAEYIVAKGDIQMHIPDNLSFQEVATLGVGITTVGQALYQSLELSLPTDPIADPVPILIYGGSTATGTLAIQFAKLSGYKVLTTCSPYYSSNTDNALKLVLDTIALEGSARFCDKALSTDGGEYSALLNVGIERSNVNARWTLAYTAIGEDFEFGDVLVLAKPQDKEFAEKFWMMAEKLFAEDKVKVHPPKVNPGELKGVLDGLNLLREGKVSGEKLVYNVDETP